MAISIKTPLTREAARKLRSGDSCLISGVIYTARDAAHKRLCELVEQGKADAPETEALLRQLLGPYVGRLDALVLGCTHYPFAAKAVSRILGEQVLLLEGGEGTARETRRRLAKADLLEEGEGGVTVINSREDPAMIRLCWELLNKEG